MSELDIGLLVGFVILTVVNVILQTARTIITVKGGVFWSSVISSIAFGFYTIMIVWTICDLPMWMKAAITAVANFAGTYLVKYVEMKVRKQRLWMVDVVIYKKNLEFAKKFLNEAGIQFSEMPIANSDTSTRTRRTSPGTSASCSRSSTPSTSWWKASLCEMVNTHEDLLTWRKRFYRTD